MSKPLPIVPIALPTPWPSVGPVHIYLIKDDPITLVDAGLNSPDSRQALLDGLKGAGVALSEVRRILLTHAHLDHYGQAGWVQAESGAEIWMHPDEAGKVELLPWWYGARDQILADAGTPHDLAERIDKVWRLSRQVTLPLGSWHPMLDGQRLGFASGELEAVHLPGHALGHTGFWEEAHGRLIGGDHLLDGVTPNPVVEPVLPGHPAAVPHAPHRALTLGQFLRSLERVMQLPIQQVLPGHGPVITDHLAISQGYIARHERRLHRLWQRIAQPATAFAIMAELYPKVQGFDIFLALSEVIAHLDLLVVQGRAVIESDGASTGKLYRAGPYA